MSQTLSECKTPEERRIFLEKQHHITFSEITRYKFGKEEKVHCENQIGTTSLPLGVAGPLLIDMMEKKEIYFVPLATTEGALIASVNRGSKVITLAGGVYTSVELVGATRGPVFETRGVRQSLTLKLWIDNNLKLLELLNPLQTFVNYRLFQ